MTNPVLRKLISVLMAAMILLGLLAGCSNTGATNGTNNTDGTNSTNGTGSAPTGLAINASGVLVVNVNGAINIFYDKDGTVLELQGIDDNGSALIASYDYYLGESCSHVVCALIEDSVNMGSLDRTRFVMVKQTADSLMPSTNFLKELASAAQTTLDALNSTAKLLVLSKEELDRNSYIDLITAKDMALSYLGNTNFDCFDGTSTPDNGSYYFTITYGTQKEYIAVNAITGLVSNAFLDMPEEDAELSGDS